MSTAPIPTIDHPTLTRLEERVRDQGKPEYLFGGTADPDETTVADDDPPSYADRLYWSTHDVLAPDPADLCERIPFLPEDDFPSWLFAVANEFLDHPSPRSRWLAERIAVLAHRAEFLSATTPEEYEAREEIFEADLAAKGVPVR